MFDLSKYGIGLGLNPNMSNPFTKAAHANIEDACSLAAKVVEANIKVLDLREWCETPGGGFWDGGLTDVKSAEQVAAWLISWYKPQVAFDRTREILEVINDKKI
jgi:hypothetical protein